jgi:recombination protein RecA
MKGDVVDTSKTRRLEMTVAAIQQRWGTKALHRLENSPATEVPHIPTGFPTLDAILGIGGIPRGRITEILGAPTSGMSTLALKIAAGAQATGDTVVYVDLSCTFDPDYAARCSIDPSKLLLVRPLQSGESLDITCAIVAGGGAGVLVFDAAPHLLSEPHSPRAFSTALQRLAGALSGSACAPVFLTSLPFGNAAFQHNYPDEFNLPHYASLRISMEKESWIRKRQDIAGYRTRVSVLKSQFGSQGKSTRIDITFNGVVHGNGT